MGCSMPTLLLGLDSLAALSLWLGDESQVPLSCSLCSLGLFLVALLEPEPCPEPQLP